ncbi:methyltransferase domain-containing protein [Candidatus Ozemobacteraceae bacterium]|nr:methyltransferase domain-containing protein [Candidatus Ozemobacteraceae bacterium]
MSEQRENDRPRRLNLGCGRYPIDGYINIDIDPASSADLRFDLASFPYPLETGGYDRIVASHVLEHLPDAFGTMREWARLLAPGGTMTIRVPHCSRGFTHPQHRAGFDVSFPLYFDSSFPGGYSGVELRLVSMRLTWFAQPELKKACLSPFQYRAALLLGRLFDVAAALSPSACSRIWAYWVGGFEEIEFVFEKPAVVSERKSEA